MDIDKPLQMGKPVDVEFDGDQVNLIEDIDEQMLDAASMTELDDGGIEIEFAPDYEDVESFLEIEHSDNLADYLSEDELNSISSDLLDGFRKDESSRKEWAETYANGLKLLGFTMEDRSEPFDGASGVWHPILAEAVVRFQSQTIGELFPPKGPVKSKVLGKMTDDKRSAARRVEAYMNYTATERMPSYRPETEKLLFTLAVAGSSFRKIYMDPRFQRPAAIYLPPEDVVVNSGATSIEDAERVTCILKVGKSDMARLQSRGFYRDVELGDPTSFKNVVEEAKAKINGVKYESGDSEEYTLLEVMVDLEFEDLPESAAGFPVPYVVTLNETDGKVLGVRRNWEEGDENYEALQHVAHYVYIPAIGFYGLGLTHLIGSIAKSSTAALRQLLDAGTLANLPGGLKTRGLRMAGDNTPIRPGEWRDVDVLSGSIADNMFPMPYNEPSPTLLNLLTMVVEDGRRFASMQDMKIADTNSDAPVGTTLAMLERAMKVQTAVQQRVHSAFKTELRVLKRIIRDMDSLEYPYEVDDDEAIVREDFDHVDIIPVSDPNSATFAQRMIRFQTAIQLSQMAPNMYDQQLLHRHMLEAIDVPDADRIIPDAKDTPILDPVAENMAVLKLTPIGAKQWQDHAAHIRVHMGLKQDPQIAQMVQNTQHGPAIMAAIDAHINEHLGYLMRKEIEEEMGAPLPPPEEHLPDDVENRLSRLVADASDALTQRKIAMAQAQQNAAMQQDPVMQQRLAELEIKKQEQQRKQMETQGKQQAQQQEQQRKAMEMEFRQMVELQRISLDQTRAQTERDRAEADLQVRMAELSARVQDGKAARLREGMKLGIEVARTSGVDR